jgi:hypothetical protein
MIEDEADGLAISRGRREVARNRILSQHDRLVRAAGSWPKPVRLNDCPFSASSAAIWFRAIYLPARWQLKTLSNLLGRSKVRPSGSMVHRLRRPLPQPDLAGNVVETMRRRLDQPSWHAVVSAPS